MQVWDIAQRNWEVMYRVHKMLMVDQKHKVQSVRASNSDPMSKLHRC
jgi:hypothetical protein